VDLRFDLGEEKTIVSSKIAVLPRAEGNYSSINIAILIWSLQVLWGAMENKSLNIFNSKLVLASPETATDGDYAAILGVIGHEKMLICFLNLLICSISIIGLETGNKKPFSQKLNLNFSQIIAFIINLYLSTRNVMTFDSICKIFV
ncbi:hypothetical protein BHE74_00022814, partial [Ensete ventricosum]